MVKWGLVALGVMCVLGGALFLSSLSSGLLIGSPSSDPHVCSMTYMWPSYRKVDMGAKSAGKEEYELYYFKEEMGSHGLTNEELNEFEGSGVPILFVPGNAGSYRQVRSLGSIMQRAHEKGKFEDNKMRTAKAWSTVSPANRLQSHSPNPPLICLQEIERERKLLKRGKFDFFALNFREQLSAFNGELLLAQRDFMADAVNRILDLYKEKALKQTSGGNGKVNLPNSVIILGHSMGGVVARSIYDAPTYRIGSVNMIIALSTPQVSLPVLISPSLHSFYSSLHTIWNNRSNSHLNYRNRVIMSQRKLETASTSNSNALPSSKPITLSDNIANTVLISIGGGWRDVQVYGSLSNLESVAYGHRTLSVLSSSVTDVWLTADHQSCMWCNQLLISLATALYEGEYGVKTTNKIADPLAASKPHVITWAQSEDVAVHRMSAFRRYFSSSSLFEGLSIPLSSSKSLASPSVLASLAARSRPIASPWKEEYATYRPSRSPSFSVSGAEALNHLKLKWNLLSHHTDELDSGDAAYIQVITTLPLDLLNIVACESDAVKGEEAKKSVDVNGDFFPCLDLKHLGMPIPYAIRVEDEQRRTYRTVKAHVWEMEVKKERTPFVFFSSSSSHPSPHTLPAFDPLFNDTLFFSAKLLHRYQPKSFKEAHIGRNAFGKSLAQSSASSTLSQPTRHSQDAEEATIITKFKLPEQYYPWIALSAKVVPIHAQDEQSKSYSSSKSSSSSSSSSSPSSSSTSKSKIVYSATEEATASLLAHEPLLMHATPSMLREITFGGNTFFKGVQGKGVNTIPSELQGVDASFISSFFSSLTPSSSPSQWMTLKVAESQEMDEMMHHHQGDMKEEEEKEKMRLNGQTLRSAPSFLLVFSDPSAPHLLILRYDLISSCDLFLRRHGFTLLGMTAAVIFASFSIGLNRLPLVISSSSSIGGPSSTSLTSGLLGYIVGPLASFATSRWIFILWLSLGAVGSLLGPYSVFHSFSLMPSSMWPDTFEAALLMALSVFLAVIFSLLASLLFFLSHLLLSPCCKPSGMTPWRISPTAQSPKASLHPSRVISLPAISIPWNLEQEKIGASVLKRAQASEKASSAQKSEEGRSLDENLSLDAQSDAGLGPSTSSASSSSSSSSSASSSSSSSSSSSFSSSSSSSSPSPSSSINIDSIQINAEDSIISSKRDFFEMLPVSQWLIFLTIALIALFIHPLPSIVLSLTWLILPGPNNVIPRESSLDVGDGPRKAQKKRIFYPASFIRALSDMRLAHFIVYGLILLMLIPDGMIWLQKERRGEMMIEEWNDLHSLPSRLKELSTIVSDSNWSKVEISVESVMRFGQGVVEWMMQKGSDFLGMTYTPVAISVALHVMMLRNVAATVLLRRTYFELPRLAVMISGLFVLFFLLPLYPLAECILWISISFLVNIALHLIFGEPSRNEEEKAFDESIERRSNRRTSSNDDDEDDIDPSNSKSTSKSNTSTAAPIVAKGVHGSSRSKKKK